METTQNSKGSSTLWLLNVPTAVGVTRLEEAAGAQVHTCPRGQGEVTVLDPDGSSSVWTVTSAVVSFSFRWLLFEFFLLGCFTPLTPGAWGPLSAAGEGPQAGSTQGKRLARCALSSSGFSFVLVVGQSQLLLGQCSGIIQRGTWGAAEGAGERTRSTLRKVRMSAALSPHFAPVVGAL